MGSESGDRTEGLAALLADIGSDPNYSCGLHYEAHYSVRLACRGCCKNVADFLAARGVRLPGVPSDVVLTNLRYNIERAEAAGDIVLEVDVVALRRLYDCLAGAVPAAPEPEAVPAKDFVVSINHSGVVEVRPMVPCDPRRFLEWVNDGLNAYRQSRSAPGDAGERERLALLMDNWARYYLAREAEGANLDASEPMPASWSAHATQHGNADLQRAAECRAIAALLRQPGAPRTEPLRERDALWCKALLATLDTREAEKVTAWFNTNRPDGGGSASEGGTR